MPGKVEASDSQLNANMQRHVSSALSQNSDMLVAATGVAVNKAAEPVTRGGAELVPIMVLISASKAARLWDERDSSVWAI